MAVVGRRYAISGEGYSTDGQITHIGGQPDVPLEGLLLPMALCADAEVRDGKLVGDPTEGALVVLAAKGGVDPDAHARALPARRDAAVRCGLQVHGHVPRDGGRRGQAGHPGVRQGRPGPAARAGDLGPWSRWHATSPIDQVREPYPGRERPARRRRACGSWPPASATSIRRRSTRTPTSCRSISDLQLLAIVGIVDPPRAEARDAIAKARTAGIRVRMITGDHAVTADAIAQQLGIEGKAITGAEFSAMSDEEADRRIDDIGVIARVAPEDKVHLVDILRRKGHIVAMTGDGVNDAPALKMADIGVAMGITGTEVSKEAAVMILTDDNFATIVRAVEQGRALYDNLVRYIRFQMACLFGFIGTFLGASIFSILGGVPFLPLQTLWINFTVDIFQAIGLGYGKQREGLMEEAPRPKDQKILPRPLFLWLAFIGIVMAAITLGVIVWAGNNYDETVAHTMGLVTFSMLHLFFSIETSDEERTIFSSELLENRDPAQDLGAVTADDLPGHDVRSAPAGARHGRAQRRAVGDLHRRRRP